MIMSGVTLNNRLGFDPSRQLHVQLQVNNRNTRTRCEICSKLTIKIPERRQPIGIDVP